MHFRAIAKEHIENLPQPDPKSKLKEKYMIDNKKLNSFIKSDRQQAKDVK